MTFQSGTSGNPNGRPKGTGSRQQVFCALVEPHKEALFSKAIDLALNGNEAMLRLFLERMLPTKPQDEPIIMDIDSENLKGSEALSNICMLAVKAVMSGAITPEEASRIASLLKAYEGPYAILEAQKINAQLERLEGPSIKKSSLVKPPHFEES